MERKKEAILLNSWEKSKSILTEYFCGALNNYVGFKYLNIKSVGIVSLVSGVAEEEGRPARDSFLLVAKRRLARVIHTFQTSDDGASAAIRW